MFNNDVQSSYGETTVMFTEDAIMDMTHSHTICIAKNSESTVFLEDGGNIGTPKSGNMDFTFPVKKTNTEICGSTSSAHDSEFKDFLASLSKSSERKEKPLALNTAPLHSDKVEEKAFFAKLKAKRSSGVKENQAPVTPATRRNFPTGSVTPQHHALVGATTLQTDIGPASMDLTENVMINSGKTSRFDEQGFTSSTFRPSSSSADTDDMEMTRSQTVAIDAKTIGVIGCLRNERCESVALTQDPNRTQIFSNDNHGMELTTPLNPPLKESQDFRTKQTESPRRWFPKANWLSSDVPFTVVPNQTSGRVSRYGDDSDDMELTRSQTVSIDPRTMTQKFSQSETGRSSTEEESGILSEDCCGMDMTEAPTGRIVAGSHTATKDAINVYLPTQEMNQQSTTDCRLGSPVSDNMEITETVSSHPPLSSCSDYMDVAESRPVFADSDGNRFKARKSLSSNANKSLLVDKANIPADQSARADMALQDCAMGLCSEAPTMSDFEDMELTRSQTVAIQDKHIGHFTLEGTKIDGNQECPPEMSLPTVGFSCSANISVEDDEMQMTKTVTKASEQTDSPTNAKVTTKPIFHLTKSGETTTNLADLEPKDITNMHVSQLKDGDEYNLCKPESSHITNPTSPQDPDASDKRNRRRSMADLQSKLQHMSRMINESPEVLPMGSVTAPICQLLRSPEKPSLEIESHPVDGNGSQNLALTVDKEESTNSEDHHSPNEKHFMTAPFNLKSKCLASKLAFGGFKPKLPQRNRPLQNTSNCMADEKPLKTKKTEVNNELYSSTLFDEINDEVIPNISDEELSETLDTKSLQGIDDINSEDPFNRSDLRDFMYEEPVLNVSQGLKRPLPENDHRDTADDEKRRKSSTNNIQDQVTVHSSTYDSCHIVLGCRLKNLCRRL